MRFLISFLFIFTSLNFSRAQTSLSDVYINYTIDVDSDEPVAALVSLGATLEIAFRGYSTKCMLKVAGGTNSVTALADHKTNSAIALMDLVDGKKALKISADKYNDALGDIKKISENPIRYTDDSKSIAGYQCQKVFMKHTESGANVIFYITNKIKPQKDLLAKALYAEIKGFPLEILVRKEGTTVRLTARKVSDQVPSSSAFSLDIPSSYKLTSIDELKEDAKKNIKEKR
jgi:hypothetical protein